MTKFVSKNVIAIDQTLNKMSKRDSYRRLKRRDSERSRRPRKQRKIE